MRTNRFLEVGNYLREKRTQKGLTQAEVASALGYRSQFIANFERGASSPPWKALRKLVRLYEIPEREIIRFLVAQQESIIREQLFGKMKPSRR
jgi:transcriptional regulator with XRE-family HTH domain